MLVRVLRSAGVRLALGYAALFGVSALTLILVLWWTTTNLLNDQLDAAIRADAQGLAEQWRKDGAAGLLSTINARIAGNVDDDAIYLVLDPAGHRVTGNLKDWPPAVSRMGRVYEIEVERNGHTGFARLHRFDLPGRFSLLVGRDVEPRLALRNLLTETLAWALLLIGILSTGGALIVRRLFNGMLSHVSATAAAISAGDLSPRVKLSGRGDEFDRLAETINDMLDRIGRLMDGVRQVSNAIAHDLRTPITRARARLEDAAEHAEHPAELRGAIERAVVDLDGVTAVFQALLRISEIEAGARRSAFTAVDVRPLLADLAELYGAVAEESGLHLDLDAAVPLPVNGDRELIQQGVANLLDNAIKFSPPGGHVRLSGERIADSLRITVSDQGPGMAGEDLSRATERFYRGETARHTPGFGLGLTLVRAVAQLHGGALLLQHPGTGLSAVLTLPVASLPEPPMAPRRHASSGSARSGQSVINPSTPQPISRRMSAD